MTVGTSSLSDISRAPPTRCSGTADQAFLLPPRSRISPRKTPGVRAVAVAHAPSGQRPTASTRPEDRDREAARLTIPNATAARAV